MADTLFNDFSRAMRRAIHYLPMGRDVVAAGTACPTRTLRRGSRRTWAVRSPIWCCSLDAIPDVLGPGGYVDDLEREDDALDGEELHQRHHYELADEWLACNA